MRLQYRASTVLDRLGLFWTEWQMEWQIRVAQFGRSPMVDTASSIGIAPRATHRPATTLGCQGQVDRVLSQHQGHGLTVGDNVASPSPVPEAGAGASLSVCAVPRRCHWRACGRERRIFSQTASWHASNAASHAKASAVTPSGSGVGMDVDSVRVSKRVSLHTKPAQVLKQSTTS